MISPTLIMVSPRCTHGISQYTENPHCTHDTLHTRHGTPWCNNGIPQCTEHPLGLLMISPTLIMVSSSVLTVFPTVLNIPGVFTMSFSILNTPSVLNDIPQCIAHSWCTAQTLCRVIMGIF